MCYSYEQKCLVTYLYEYSNIDLIIQFSFNLFLKARSLIWGWRYIVGLLVIDIKSWHTFLNKLRHVYDTWNVELSFQPLNFQNLTFQNHKNSYVQSICKRSKHISKVWYALNYAVRFITKVHCTLRLTRFYCMRIAKCRYLYSVLFLISFFLWSNKYFCLNKCFIA